MLVMLALPLMGCEKTSSQIETEMRDKIRTESLETLKEHAQGLADNFIAYGLNAKEVLHSYKDKGQNFFSTPFDIDMINRLDQFFDAHGDIKSATVDEVNPTATGYTVRYILTGEDDKQMAYTAVLDEHMVPVSSSILEYSDDSKESLGSKMKVAGSNTLTGLLVVFCMLVLLCLIITSFRLFGGVESKSKNKQKADAPKPQNAPAKPEPASVAPVVPANENDPALIAVIAAAIAALEDKPAEGFVVRSIRRLPNNKWH